MSANTTPLRILYCHCAFARVVPAEVKNAVLSQLSAAEVEFEAVADLCEMSARRDPRIATLAGTPGLRIAACFPRAVRGLFQAVDSPLAPDVRILNMRTEPAAEVAASLLVEAAS